MLKAKLMYCINMSQFNAFKSALFAGTTKGILYDYSLGFKRFYSRHIHIVSSERTQRADTYVGHLAINAKISCDSRFIVETFTREKTVFGVSDQVRHKPGCTATEDS